MLLNCGVGEDSWDFLGLQGEPTSPSKRSSVLNIHWKDWFWSWSFNTLTTWCEELTHWKRPWCRKDWRQEEKGETEGEMIGWHHRLDGYEFEQALGVGDGQGGLACSSPWGHKELDTAERPTTAVALERVEAELHLCHSESLYFRASVFLFPRWYNNNIHLMESWNFILCKQSTWHRAWHRDGVHLTRSRPLGGWGAQQK